MKKVKVVKPKFLNVNVEGMMRAMGKKNLVELKKIIAEIEAAEKKIARLKDSNTLESRAKVNLSLLKIDLLKLKMAPLLKAHIKNEMAAVMIKAFKPVLEMAAIYRARPNFRKAKKMRKAA